MYAYIRRRARDAEAAQDLTQSFFAHLLENNVIAVAKPERGRFRAFLKTAVTNFVINEWQNRTAEKRGGGHHHVSLDFADGERRYSLEPSDGKTPERLYVLIAF